MSTFDALQTFRASCIDYINTKQRALFLTTSNRWSKEKNHEQPKSTELALDIAKQCKTSVVTLDIPSLNIVSCEGNVSTRRGNTCGVQAAALPDAQKNPSGHHRCWASINSPEDELWKVSRALLESDCVVFFGSVRWGQMNAQYQRLIERLTWLENRHSTLGEENILKDIDVGIVAMGHNWRGAEVMATQKQVLGFFGFRVIDQLCAHFEYTDPSDESDAAYTLAAAAFAKNIKHI